MPYEQEEILDIVNTHDAITGQMSRTEYYRTDPKPGFVRSVNLFFINSEGKVWVPRRSSSQRIKPNALDYSAGGHVSAGETYEQAMLREAEEELGLRVDPAQLIHIGKLPPNGTPGRDYYFCDCFAYYSDETPRYPADEFSGYEWLSPQELMARLDAGENTKDSLRDSLQLLLDYQAEHSGNQ